MKLGSFCSFTRTFFLSSEPPAIVTSAKVRSGLMLILDKPAGGASQLSTEYKCL
ncbi:hypothetical protein APA_5043 [Pseudanabaena sp. lw0831]|nr:hypothetical protein APA_5043 [Pseudanabaena sp. lw0831]